MKKKANKNKINKEVSNVIFESKILSNLMDMIESGEVEALSDGRYRLITNKKAKACKANSPCTKAKAVKATAICSKTKRDKTAEERSLIARLACSTKRNKSLQAENEKLERRLNAIAQAA